MPPSGRQWDIRHGDQVATVVEVGGGLRRFTAGRRDVVEGYPLGSMCDGAHGSPLVPWPNRIEDGRYEFDGQLHQLPLNEPTRGNAIHGLLLWQPWSPVSRAADRIVLAARIHPQPGYPFDVHVEIAYALDADGIRVTTTATNRGPQRCPVAFGFHPYLSPGQGVVDDCVLTLPAQSLVVSDPDRLLPRGQSPVAGTPYDFRTPRRIGALEIDHAFTELGWDSSMRARTTLTGADGLTVELWQDESCPYVQVFSGDTLAPHRRRRGLAVEPMSAMANAFRTGDHVSRLEPGHSVEFSWGASLR
jgi:aldose 1-epimerase